MGEPFVKQFVEERDLNLFLVIDVSGSLSFGSRAILKRELAAEIAALLSFAALRNQDRVGAALVADDLELYLRPERRRNHVLRMVRDVLMWPASGGTDLERGLRAVLKNLKQRSVLFIISDFVEAPCSSAIKAAAARHDVILIEIVDPRDLEVPSTAPLVLRDAETGRRQVISGRSWGRELAKNREQSREELTKLTRRLGLRSRRVAYRPPLPGSPGAVLRAAAQEVGSMNDLIAALILAASVAPTPSLEVAVSPQELTVGDRAQVRLVLRLPESTPTGAVSWPEWETSLGGAEILDIGPVEAETAESGGRLVTQTLDVVFFEVGKAVIPAIGVGVDEPSGQAAYTSQPVHIAVLSVLPEGEADPQAKPPAPPRKLALGERFWLTAGSLAATCALALALLLLQTRRLEAPSATRSMLSPRQELDQSLQTLGSEADAAVVFTGASMSARRYLGTHAGLSCAGEHHQRDPSRLGAALARLRPGRPSRSGPERLRHGQVRTPPRRPGRSASPAQRCRAARRRSGRAPARCRRGRERRRLGGRTEPRLGNGSLRCKAYPHCKIRSGWLAC